MTPLLTLFLAHRLVASRIAACVLRLEAARGSRHRHDVARWWTTTFGGTVPWVLNGRGDSRHVAEVQ